MGDILEFLLDILTELLAEGSLELGSDPKVSKWIRYPILGLILLLIIAVTGGLLFLGIVMLRKDLLSGLLFLSVGILFLIGFFVTVRRFLRRNRENV